MSSVLGLKVRPSTAMRLAGDAAAAGVDDALGHRGLARVVAADHGLDDAQRRARLLRGPHQREAVLGEARAAVAGPGMQELAADAAVEADAARHVLHVGADLLAQIGDLVDEGDLGGEEAVGRVFGQLGGLERGEEDRRLDQVERAVELAHARRGRARLSAPITTRSGRMKSSIAEPSRRNSGLEATSNWPSGRRLAQDLGDLAAGADRHGRFGDDHGIAGRAPRRSPRPRRRHS